MLTRNLHIVRTIFSVLMIVSWGSTRNLGNAADLDSDNAKSENIAPSEVDFAGDIRPLLNQHCVGCHGGVKQAGEISFIYRESALQAVEPGDAENSTLIDRVLSDDPDERMPPPDHGRALTADEVKLFRTWINQGAKWAGTWSYEAIDNPTIPRNTSGSDAKNRWVKGPIDSFVLDKLKAQSLQPSKEASPQQWLRRVTLDLVGRPPSVDRVLEFENEVRGRGDRAYVDEVDRLLADPGFGERWATVWLDQMRYADSRGLGLDARRSIWKYRDWVVNAINDDMPFDEFTIKQLAGDLLPDATIGDKVATASCRLTQTNEEGGTDDEEFRVAAVIDRVSTVWQSWQGLTFGCVQCHSHPYEPIDHREFYEFAAFFNNSADCDLSDDRPVIRVPLDDSNNAKATQLDDQIEQLTREVWAGETSAVKLFDDSGWTPIESFEADADRETKLTLETRDGHREFVAGSTLSNQTRITITPTLPESIETVSAFRLTISPRDPESAWKDSEWGFVISHLRASLIRSPEEGDESGSETVTDLKITRVVGDEAFPMMDPDQSLVEKSRDGFSAYSRIHYPRSAVFVLSEPVTIDPGQTIKLSWIHKINMLGAFPLVTRRGRLDVTDDVQVLNRLNDPPLRAMRTELVRLKVSRKSIASVSLPVMQERPGSLQRPSFVFNRGLFLTKGDEVSPGVPAAFPPLPDHEEGDDGDAGSATRLQMARWLVSLDNPLTARVTVNRIWARLFGMGLVATEEDFGVSGEPPSHPELLDHLAHRFRTSDRWSVKRITRDLVLSSTYRQSGSFSADEANADPSNRFLSRGPRFRMSAEMFRDSALFASGLLTNAIGGPPVHPPIPKGVWKPFSAGDKWTTDQTNSEDRYRRSIYTYTKRSIPYPMFAAFDAPSREFCTPRRLRSNTPLQALMTLNSESFVECAKSLAKQMKRSSDSVDEQIRYGFVSVVSREPTENEMTLLRRALENLQTTDGNSDEHLADGDKAGDAVDESDPMVSLATVLLNLDEVLSK